MRMGWDMRTTATVNGFNELDETMVVVHRSWHIIPVGANSKSGWKEISLSKLKQGWLPGDQTLPGDQRRT